MSADPEQPKRRKPATGPQLWRLNQLGLLREAIGDDGKAWADTCHRLIAEALDERPTSGTEPPGEG